MVATTYEECLERNKQRDRIVPEDVIKRMYYNFYVPQYFEGFDDIQIKFNSNYKFMFSELKDIEHDNPHHSLSILEHCHKAEENIKMILDNTNIDIRENNILTAAILHDIGKLRTKTFINAKGEETDIAHYYNHEKVGAYDSLFYRGFDGDREDLYVVKLIQWHMLPYANLQEKTILKYKKLLGEEFWNDLMILHKADEEAH